MKRTPASTQRSLRWSPGCAPVGTELATAPLGMPVPGRADDHVRPEYRSNVFASRGSALV